jgi:hypothetical protein
MDAMLTTDRVSEFPIRMVVTDMFDIREIRRMLAFQQVAVLLKGQDVSDAVVVGLTKSVEQYFEDGRLPRPGGVTPKRAD